MSLKFYNNVTQRWEHVSSTVATGIKVVDLESRFEGDTVNECLLETAASLETLSGRVEYIYENGTIGGGGGGGGGGGVLPAVTIDGSDTRNVKSDETIDVYYFFTSPNQGDGNVSISYGSVTIAAVIKQGRNKQTIGPFVKGIYTVTILVQDSQSFYSVPIHISVISGSLDLLSTFTDALDFTLTDNIVIPYTITTLISEAVFLDYWIDNVKFTAPAQIGANTLTFGKLQHMGPTFVRMQVRNTSYTSNILNYSLVASDSTNLFLIPVTYPDTSLNTIVVGSNLVLDYRVSMKNQFSFNTVLYVGEFGQTRFANVVSKPGVNYWNIGIAGFDNLSIGPHIFRIVATTLDGLHTDSIDFAFTVSASNYVPYPHITANLIAQFDAAGKINTSVDRDVWLDTSGNHVGCSLYNFNFTTNGWHNNALDVSGRSYAVIDLSPFKFGIKNGFTCEVIFKTVIAGDVDAKVISCRNPLTPYQGFEINTAQAVFVSASDTVQSQIQVDTWTKATFVVNRGDPSAGRPHTMLLYINGEISSVSFLQANNPNMADYADAYSYDGKIYVGAGLDTSMAVANNSVASIKTIRIYDRALSDVEVITNYIADITDPDEQVAARTLNSMNANGAFTPLTQTLPRLDFLCNIDSMDENAKRQVQQVRYEDPADPSKNFTADFPDCTISWQGTSSRIYPVKNWTLELSKQGNIWLYTPKDDWLPDARWTLKANYMDSSNANNIGLQKYIRAYFKTNDPAYPNEIINPLTRANVDGFPVTMTMNGVFMGIFTWNIDRYGLQNYGFVTYSQVGTGPVVTNRRPNAFSYEILANTSEGAGAFKLPYAGGDTTQVAIDGNWNAVRTEFRCRYSQDTSPTIVLPIQGVQTEVLTFGKHQQLLSLVEWVSDADDQEFVESLTKHFSLQHLIDYYLIAYVFGMVDNLGKNMVISTWGANTAGDVIWFPSFYDCDTVLGLNNSGFVEYDAGLDTSTGDYNTSNSNLWTKLNRNYGGRISDRYQVMRLNQISSAGTLPPWFSYDTTIKYLGGQVMDKIGPMLTNQDARVKYLPVVPPPGQTSVDLSWSHACNGSRREFTERWLKERFIYLDSVYEFAYFEKVVIRSNVQGEITLRVKTYSPQWVKVSFTDSADAKQRKQVRSTAWTDFTYVVTNASDNNIEIYAANNIMYIDGINDLDAGSINIAQAQKLIELDISGSTKITELSLGSNSYLQKLKCNDCVTLGYQVVNRTLDISGCTNLRELNVSNTHIQSVRFNDIGGVIEILDASRTDITSFKLTGQDYLSSISLGLCKDLSTLEITSCGGLQSLLLPDTNLSSIKITGCDKLSTLDISRTRNLKTFNISGSPNLRTLTMTGVSNIGLSELDLSYAPLLETFDMSSSGYIQFLTLPAFPAPHSHEKLNIVNFQAILDKKYANSIVVRLTDIGDPILTSDFTKFVDPATGYTIITLIQSVRIPSEQRFIYVDYTNNCALSTLRCNNSAIMSVKFGRTAPYPSRTDGKFALDLNGLPLTSVNFSGCGSLVEVRNIVYTATGSSAVFNGCTLLQTITGTIVLRDNIDSAFRDCNALKLDGLILDLTNVTSMLDTFWNCRALTAVNANYVMTRVGPALTRTQRLFAGCTGISGTFFQTYPTCFAKFTNVTSIYECFNVASGITGLLPAGLMTPMVNLVDASYAFSNTNLSGAIPTGFFDANIKLTTCVGTFQNSRIDNLTTPQAFLFRNNTELSSVSAMFANTQLLMQIDENLFVANRKLTDVSYFFQSCTKIFGGIPPNLFNNIPTTASTNLLRYMNYFLNTTNVTGEIAIGFLDSCRNLEQAEGLFNSCVNLTGAIPTDLLLFNTKLSRVGAMFASCGGLTGVIPPNLLRGKPQLSTANRLFFNCANIDTIIPDDFMTDNPALTDVSEMFSGCSKLHGSIPSRVSYWTSTENFDLVSKVVLNFEVPDLTQLYLKQDAASPVLVKDVDYRVAIDASGQIVTITLVTLQTLATVLVNLPHAVPITFGVVTIPSDGIAVSSLVVKNVLGVVYTLNTDYTVNTTGGNVVITRTGGSAIPIDTATIYVSYDYTAPVYKVGILNSFNIDLSSAPTVRPLFDDEAGAILTRNLNPTTGVATPDSTVAVTGLSSVATCVVRVSGVYTGALTPQTTTDGVTWVNIATNALLNLNTNTNGTTIASAANSVYQFACSGKIAVRIAALAVTTGTATVAIYVNKVTASPSIDYTLALNAVTGYIELTSARTSVLIPPTQMKLIVTYKHLDPTMIDRLDIVNRSTRPSLLGQIETVTKFGMLDKQVNLIRVAGMFNGCGHSQFNTTIPAKLFLNGSKITDMSTMFTNCWYLSGWLPPALLYNCAALTNVTYMFGECVNIKDPTSTYAIPPGFFDNCPNITTFRSMFQNSNPSASKPHAPYLTGVVHKDLFKNNRKATDIGYMFWGCGTVNGTLDSDLFKFNILLSNVGSSFVGTGLTSLGPNLFRTCVAMTDMSYAFWSCGSLTGFAPSYWASDHPLKAVATRIGCFRGDTALSNWNLPLTDLRRIPDTWR